MFRVLLPPNLAVAAARDAVAIKVEFDSAAATAAELGPALTCLQRWTGGPVGSPLFLQLSRGQLHELIATLTGRPVFFWINRPGAPVLWEGQSLAGVSDHLVDTKPEAPAAPKAEIRPAPRPAGDANATPLVIDGSEYFLAATLPSRGHPTYAEALELVKRHDFVLETSNRKWWLRDRRKTLNFLAAHWTRLRGHFGAKFTPNFERNTARLQLAEVTCMAAESSGGYDVTLTLRAGKATEAAVEAALAGGQSYVEDTGVTVLLPVTTVERFTHAQRALSGDAATHVPPRRTFRVSGARLVEVDALMEPLAPHFEPPATWRRRSEALRNLAKLAPAPVPAALDARLRPYQRIGVAWLWHLRQHDLGGILADEMGLGKTIQALALLAALPDEPSEISNLKSGIQRGPSLVVAPASLVENWRREAERFVPELKVLVHHGGQRPDQPAAFAGADLVITSYGTLVRDQVLFASVEFACVIADEAQHLKNRRTENARTLRTLRARNRFLLTGTPLENSLDDLRSLFDFLMPGYLAPVPAGARGDEKSWHDERLHAQTAPYILRRTKAVVAPELPPKIEQIVWCELPPAQAALYREWQRRGEREFETLAADGASEARLRLATLTQLLRLRQICCDPRLVDVAQSGANAPATTGKTGAEVGRVIPYAPPTEDGLPGPDSAKLEAFRELLEEAVDDSHRVLVFSQFTTLLTLLRTELETQTLPFCYLDGAMPARDRQREIDRFQGSAEVPVFLISLKAGGTGLNLTGADTVVHFDPWWNPAVEAQATDRAHRIGQTRVVTSYKLICAGTVEEKILQLQDAKRSLLAGIFEASDEAAARLSLDDLRALLAP